MIFRKTWIWFPVPTCQLTTIQVQGIQCYLLTSVGTSCMWCIYIHADKQSHACIKKTHPFTTKMLGTKVLLPVVCIGRLCCLCQYDNYRNHNGEKQRGDVLSVATWVKGSIDPDMNPGFL